jgi:hypothetical protein
MFKLGSTSFVGRQANVAPSSSSMFPGIEIIALVSSSGASQTSFVTVEVSAVRWSDAID